MKHDRWEYGSEYHWEHRQAEMPERTPYGEEFALYGSGRDALRALLVHGMETRGWGRLWIPAYFCQEVAASILSTGIDVQVYQDGPQDPASRAVEVRVRRGDAIFTVAYFGIRPTLPREAFDSGAADLIEDHSHDPWSQWAARSTADWCVCSLRKTLPIPDGGVLWSPQGHKLPAPATVTDERRLGSLQKLSAMALKRLYLEGYEEHKSVYRSLSTGGERHIGSGQISGMPEWTRDLLRLFPAGEWRDARQRNHGLLSTLLQGANSLTVLQPQRSDGNCPFSVIVVLDTEEQCSAVRERLLISNVYPARLWPLESPVVAPIAAEYLGFSRRMLSIACDGRYSDHDIRRVASVIRGVCNVHV